MKRIREDEFRIFDPSKEFQRSGIRNIPIRISQWCEVVQRIYPDAESSGCLLCMFSDGRVVCEIVYENVFFLRRYAGRKFFPALPVQQKDRVFHLFRFLPAARCATIFTPVRSRTDIASKRRRFSVTKSLYAESISDTAKLAA